MGKSTLITPPNTSTEAWGRDCPACGHSRLSRHQWNLRSFLGLKPLPARCAHMEADEAGLTAECYCRNAAHGS